MGAEEINAFLTHLAVEKDVAASTQSQALSALLFLYKEVLQENVGWIADIVRATRPKRLPVVFTREEVVRLLGGMAGVERLVGELLYGTGLRVIEAVRLRVKDLDFALSRKYPGSGRAWARQYVFPAGRISVDPRSGERRRHHFDERLVQRSFATALKVATIPKTVKVAYRVG